MFNLYRLAIQKLTMNCKGNPHFSKKNNINDHDVGLHQFDYFVKGDDKLSLYSKNNYE